MSGFVFRFDTILNTKEKLEDQEKNKLGISVQKLLKEQKTLEKCFQEKQEVLEKMNQKSKQPVKIKDLRKISNDIQYMQKKIEEQVNIVKESELEQEKRRIKLIEASKEKKVFEKLKEKDLEEFKYTEMKKEDSMVDEFVCYQATNR